MNDESGLISPEVQYSGYRQRESGHSPSSVGIFSMLGHLLLLSLLQSLSSQRLLSLAWKLEPEGWKRTLLPLVGPGALALPPSTLHCHTIKILTW